MHSYYATFTRYSGQRAEREISGEFHIQAEDFDAAYRGANLAMRAMKEAPPVADWQYEIVSIRTTEYSGTRFTGFTSIWENPPSAEKAKGKVA